MAIPSPSRVVQQEASVRPEDPNTRITSLEEVIKRVSKSVEAIGKEGEDLTSWLLLRKDIKLEERRKSIHAG
jgi:hypothetical protein